MTCGKSKQVQKPDHSPNSVLSQPFHAVCSTIEKRGQILARAGEMGKGGWMLSWQCHQDSRTRHSPGLVWGGPGSPEIWNMVVFLPVTLVESFQALGFLSVKQWVWEVWSRDFDSFAQWIFIKTLPLARHCPMQKYIIFLKYYIFQNKEHLCSTYHARHCSKNFIHICPFNL